MQVGDRVTYSKKFCQSIGDYTDLPHKRGEIIGFQVFGDKRDPLRLAIIKWDAKFNPEPSKVNVKNLILESKIHLEPA